MEERKAGLTIEKRTCDICGSDEYSVFWERKPWSKTYGIKVDGKPAHQVDVVCSKCGLVYKNPVMTKESIRDYYASEQYLRDYKQDDVDQISKDQISFETEASVYRMDFFDNIDYDLNGKDILDVGSASGVFSAFLSSHGANVTSLEPSDRKCKIQKVLFYRDAVCSSIEDYTTPQKYDMISICDTLEHLWSPAEALLSINKLLKDDGILFLEVPDIWYPYVDNSVDAFLSSVHLHTFSQYTIQLLLNRCGFCITQLNHSGHKKCMLITAVKDGECYGEYNPEDWPAMLANLIALEEVNKYFEGRPENWKPTKEELSQMLANYPNYSNYIQLVFATRFLQLQMFNESIESFVIPWNQDQSASTHYDIGNLRFIQGMANRGLGNFETANQYFDMALLQFPGLDRYNFIKELIVSGKLPSSFFDKYGITTCKLMKT